MYSQTIVKRPFKIEKNVLIANGSSLMQVESIAEFVEFISLVKGYSRDTYNHKT